MRIVIDTNVLVSALRSQRGASFRLIQKLGSPQFQPVISPPLCLEYEDVLSRPGLLPGYTAQDIRNFIDYFLRECVECRIHFLWRPHLVDPKDDLLLELALAGSATFVVTHNTRDFQGGGGFGDSGRDTGPIPEYPFGLMSKVNVTIPDSLYRRAQTLAEVDGIPLDQLIAMALAEKVAVLDADSYIRERAECGNREEFDRVLAKVPDVEPEEYDRLSP